jgi:hypothetical protein
MESDGYNKVKNRLLNKLLVILAILIFPAIIVSLLRVFQTGWQPAFFIQAALVPLVVLIAIFRNVLPLKVKALSLILFAFIVAVVGLIQFSLSSSAIQYMMMGVLVAVVFLGSRAAVWVYALSAVVLAIIGSLTFSGVILPSIDLGNYNTYASTWANNSVTFLSILGLMTILVGNIGQILHCKIVDLKRKNDELQKALSEIKTLRGIIPICSYCKKVRDDSGYWDRVDIYVRNHSEADFSHSICPECVRTHFPGIKIKEDYRAAC